MHLGKLIDLRQRNLAIDQNAFNFLIDRRFSRLLHLAKQIIANYIIKQDVQGLQAFSFSDITFSVNDEHTILI